MFDCLCFMAFKFVPLQGPAKPFEIRTLNFLINEYLLKNNYRLTSVTFADQVGDQVNLLSYAMPKGP